MLLSRPGASSPFCRWRPFSIAAFRIVHGVALEGLTFGTVIDVGANVGKFSRAAWDVAEGGHHCLRSAARGGGYIARRPTFRQRH